MTERSTLLQTKLAANAQRRYREDDLAQLPAHLSAYLEQCDYIASSEVDELEYLFNNSPKGLWRNEGDGKAYGCVVPEGYCYADFAWRHQLFEVAASLGTDHDHEPALFGQRRGPIYHASFGWVRQNIAELYKGGELCVVTTDYSVGLVISHYSGYLRYDLGPTEVVYQLALWGFDGIKNNNAISESQNFTLLKAAEYKTLIYQCEDVYSGSIIEETAQFLSDHHDLSKMLIAILQQEPIPKPDSLKNEVSGDYFRVEVTLEHYLQIMDWLTHLHQEAIELHGEKSAEATKQSELWWEWQRYM